MEGGQRSSFEVYDVVVSVCFSDSFSSEVHHLGCQELCVSCILNLLFDIEGHLASKNER